MGTPLSVTQMLWVNIVMDTLAALALGGEPAWTAIWMKNQSAETNPSSAKICGPLLVMGIYLTTASLVFLQHPFFQSLFRLDGEMVYEGHDIYFMTGFFCFYVLSAMLNGFNARTEKLNIFDNIMQNKMFSIYHGADRCSTGPYDLYRRAYPFGRRH